jgi:D-beta-D-heptose 7-phosphate kinase/D-beta-D-heptose 1-phosphate adenosyltransferase
LDDKVGGAANVARNIAHLDGKVTLMGIVGEDENGTCLNDLLSQEHIQSKLVVQNDQPTITKLRVISRQQQVVRLDFEENFGIALPTGSKIIPDIFEDIVNDTFLPL